MKETWTGKLIIRIDIDLPSEQTSVYDVELNMDPEKDKVFVTELNKDELITFKGEFSNLDIIFGSRTKIYGMAIFPFYILLPRCLPFITLLLLSIPFQTDKIGIIPFYSASVGLFALVCLFNPFFGLQIIAIHCGWIYAIIHRKKGTVWHNKARRTVKNEK